MGRHELHVRGAQIESASGIEYGYWETMYNGGGAAATYVNQLGTGSYTVTVTNNNSALSNSIKLVSTGTQLGDSWTTTKVMNGVAATVFDYAICSNGGLFDGSSIYTGTPNGGRFNLNAKGNGNIRANGNIVLDSNSSGVNGTATTAGTASITNIAGSITQGGSQLPFPVISLSTYQGLASITYSSSQTFNGYFFLLPGTVVYVNGNVTLNSGSYTGIGTIVASGSITINGGTSYGIGGLVAFISPTGITVAKSVSVVGYYYTHNSTNTAALTENGTSSLTVSSGGVAADVFNLGGNSLASVHDPNMTLTYGHEMSLPGD
jgi:hypothetical protein